MTRGAPRGGSSAPESRLGRLLERAAILLASVALSIGLIVLTSGFFAGRDQAGVTGAGPESGQVFPDLGHATLRAGEARPQYDSNPPTSGAHFNRPVTQAISPLSDDQLLSALQAGDVVIFYGTARPPAGLEQFVRSAAPAFTPDLAATGDAVILARRPGTPGLLAAAWTHLLPVRQPSDPLLREFVGEFLGRGAPGGGG
ncbi:MAG: DUF3105 domain-containing protein [Solirubrobacterales bacterium]|nr:DUF3105 domain-containing protein [Solirubrobacterales bacterium]